MNRPRLVIAVNIIQLLLTLLLAATSVYVLFLMRSPETLQQPDAADTIHGLVIGAAVLGAPALFLTAALWGLWRNKQWGWWLALVTDVVIVATLGYSMIGQNSSDLTEPVWTLCFVVCAILLLLPKVRRFYWAPKV
jgi:uncharacterized membrane protein (DUF2068 family)